MTRSYGSGGGSGGRERGGGGRERGGGDRERGGGDRERGGGGRGREGGGRGREGGSGGGPEWQRKQRSQEIRQDDDDFDADRTQLQRSGMPNWEQKLDRLSRYDRHEETVEAVRVDFGKRFVAIIIDGAASYVVASIVNVIPYLNAFVGQRLAMTLFLLVRDYLFQGRGIGKNLMGLQVVDVRTNAPCGLWQSIQRNLIVLGPILVLDVIMVALRIVDIFAQGKIPFLNEALLNIITSLGTAYVCLVIPYEAYRVYNRADGRRFGDQLAGTAVVDAPMDFSTPLPRQ